MRTSISLIAIAVCALATPALADESEASWTGPYIGGSIGHVSAKSDQTVVLSGNWSAESTALRTYVTANYPSQIKAKDISIGAQMGYNVQMGNNLVAGVEADVTTFNGDEAVVRTGLAAPSPVYAVTNRLNPKSTYSLRGKLGFAAGNTLIYATGGWSWTGSTIDVDITSNAGYHKTASVKHTFNGYQVGGGIEQRLGSGLSIRAEYTYSDQGKVSFTTAYATGSTFQTPAYGETFTQNRKQQQIRLGMNFHF